ncbi:ABC transporter ATP-binding protein [Gaetbulibacter aestuarii]|uniref:ABC transporter ATP-binding protein n=1 Tax=Gaetbulibacter aestuarii TaxID=1502358 RepID=A0ABW7MVW4_9FLAO
MLQVKNLTFSYDKSPVLQNLSFEVAQGDHFAIIGESGSGKSTLLKLLYGTYDLDEGQLFWKDQEILGPKHNLIIGPEYMKYVAQEFDLMPFTTAAENVGEFLSNFYPEKKKERTQELLKVVELEEVANTKVKLLSGGQKQRVAIARAIAKKPEILLLDEPFSHIDNFKKQSLRRSLFAYLKEKNITCIVATHDKEDVISFSDDMIVIHDAQIMAQGSPEALYKDPKNKLVASFFNEFNMIDGELVYAHQLKVVPKSKLKVIVQKSYYKGSYYLIEGLLNDSKVFFEHKSAFEKGTAIYIEKE